MELKYGKFIAITLMDHDDLSVDDVIGEERGRTLNINVKRRVRPFPNNNLSQAR